jgi:hypothetical protein
VKLKVSETQQLTSFTQGPVYEVKTLWEVAHQVCTWRVLHLQDHVGEQQRVAGEQALRNLQAGLSYSSTRCWAIIECRVGWSQVCGAGVPNLDAIVT